MEWLKWRMRKARKKMSEEARTSPRPDLRLKYSERLKFLKALKRDREAAN